MEKMAVDSNVLRGWNSEPQPKNIAWKEKQTYNSTDDTAISAI